MDFSNDISLDSALINFTKLYGKLDYVIHNAGITRAKTNEIYDQVNFENTKRFVRALQRNKQVPEKFMYISSLASFGPSADDKPITYQHIQKPLTGYGKSKMKAEEFLYATPFFPFLIIFCRSEYLDMFSYLVYLFLIFHKKSTNVNYLLNIVIF